MAFEKILVALLDHVLEGHQLMAARVLQHLLVLSERHAQRCGQFLLGRRAPVLLFKLGNGFLDAAEITTQATRQPVVLAQAVEHGAADALCRVSLELRTHPCLETTDRVEQAHHAVLHQIMTWTLDGKRAIR